VFEKEKSDMARLLACIAVSIVGLTTAASVQVARPPSGSDYFVGSWMINPAKTVNWSGRDNTTFEFIMFKVENDIQERDVETGYGVADMDGNHKHARTRNSVKFNEFDPAKAKATNISVYGRGLPPMTPQETDSHLVTIKVDDRTHIGFNKQGGVFIRHMEPDLKEYNYIGFGADGKVPLHRWSYRVKKAGDPNIPEPLPKTN
jgi:hypothetical protein